ncbi:MAG: hypothetical protein AABX66_02470 [Nanoarchaeota archaeon]
MKKNKRDLRILKYGLVALLGLSAMGVTIGMESNVQPFNNVRVQDSSFRAYLNESRKQVNNSALAYALAVWTYPGAKLGVAIHNYSILDNTIR